MQKLTIQQNLLRLQSLPLGYFAAWPLIRDFLLFRVFFRRQMFLYAFTLLLDDREGIDRHTCILATFSHNI